MRSHAKDHFLFPYWLLSMDYENMSCAKGTGKTDGDEDGSRD